MTSPLLSWRGTINDPCQHYWMKNPHCPSVAAQPGNWNSSLGLAIEESAFISFTVGGSVFCRAWRNTPLSLPGACFYVAIKNVSNFKNKDYSFQIKKPTLSKLQLAPPPHPPAESLLHGRQSLLSSGQTQPSDQCASPGSSPRHFTSHGAKKNKSNQSQAWKSLSKQQLQT